MYGFMICLVIIIIIGILIVRRNNKIIENEEKKIKEIEESSQNISIKFKAEGDSIEDEYTNWDENEDDEEDIVEEFGISMGGDIPPKNRDLEEMIEDFKKYIDAEW